MTTLLRKGAPVAARAWAWAVMVAFACAWPVKGQHPLYKKPLVTPTTPNYKSATEIDISAIPVSTNWESAAEHLNSRAAAAIFKAAQSSLITHGDDGDSISGTTVLAKWAYADYFSDGQGAVKRQDVIDLLRTAGPGYAGTTEGSSFEREYDFLMHFYIPMVYRYYDELADPQFFGGSIDLREHVINDLLGGAVRSGIPERRRVAGRADAHEYQYYHYTTPGVLGVEVTIFDVPETENHLLGINAARYLINQLLYTRTYDSQYDNNRNGDPDKSIQPTTQFLLELLGTVPGHPGFLNQDFAEYNGRPYQDASMSALLNLATYAYESRVKMAARMVLDYISAKVAVSSCDLRRAPPFRRRNEIQHYGPARLGGYLAAPLVHPTDPGNFEPDPQGAFYALLAGNTSLFAGTVPGNYDEEMVHAGICEYRVPNPILDLFTNPKHRHFYQSFRHNAGDGVNANELYYGSPSFLLSAGGNPTGFCYKIEPNVAVEVLIHTLGAIVGAPFEIQAFLGALELDSNVRGLSADMGSAMPSVLIPTGEGDTLETMLQFGVYAAGGDEEEHAHLGVAPDFICGRDPYLPNALPGDVVGNWLFVNKGHAGEDKPGFYLAINEARLNGIPYGFVETYDTWLNNPPLRFDQFKNNILSRYGNGDGFGPDTEHTYITQSGYTIKFKIDLDEDKATAEIVQSPDMTITQPDRNRFVSGTILNSEESDGNVTKLYLTNPAFGHSPIVLDLSDPAHGPKRVSEFGVVEATGVPYEVWVNPNAPVGLAEAGDFGAPFKTLGAASKVVAPGGTIKIVPGSIKESVKIKTPMTLISFPGGAVIGK